MPSDPRAVNIVVPCDVVVVFGVKTAGWTMNVYETEEYGSDTTYYATTADGIAPVTAVKPTSA